MAAYRLRTSPQASTSAGSQAALNGVAILFAAHNEQEHIAARLENLVAAVEELRQVATTIPCGKVEVYVGCDGCTDRTVAIARETAKTQPMIRVYEFIDRRGKVAVLKDLMRLSAPSDIVVFTDANTLFRPGALPALLRHFADPTLGGVCGRLVLLGRTLAETGSGSAPAKANRPEGYYWLWENRLKEWEGRLDSCLGANGAIYAIRRELFWHAIPENTIVDDFVLGMKVREQGRRMLYEPGAVAEEELPATEHEWRRRIRIGAGDFQALVFCRRCLLPQYGVFAWSFWSHKVLRWFTPHLLLCALVLAIVVLLSANRTSTPVSSMGELGRIVAGGYLVFFGLGLLATGGARLMRRFGPIRGTLSLLAVADHFLTMQAALLGGWLKFCRGDLKGHWPRTPREKSKCIG